MIETSSTPVDAPTISMRILLFSVLREGIGRGDLEISIPPGSSAKDLLDHLSKSYPVIESHRSIIRVAINQVYVDESAEVSQGDEIALITPVSGG